MRIINSLCRHSLQIIIILTLIFTSSISAQYDTYLTHLEDPAKDLRLFDTFTNNDGTLLIQMIRYSNPELTCIYPDINLRIVYPDGTVKSLEVAHQIPNYNFCMLKNVFDNCFLNKYTILITYFNGENEATTIHTGMIIDWDGNILQYIELGIGIGKINRNINEEMGFTWSRQVNDTVIAWSRFIPSPSKPTEIMKIGSGFMSSPNPLSIIKSYKLFSSSDGGNGVILVTKVNKTINDPVSDSAWEVYAMFIDKNAVETSAPYLVYQSIMDWVDLTFDFCWKTIDGRGYSCLVFITTIEPAAQNTPAAVGKGKGKEPPVLVPKISTIRYRLTFLSSGSVTSIKRLIINSDPNKSIERFYPLSNFEFLAIYTQAENERMTGFFLTQDGGYDGEWKGFNSDVMMFDYLEHNDTMWGMLFPNDSSSWTIITDPLRDKNFVHNYKFRNPNILETTPTDMMVNSKYLHDITIQYDKPVIFSSGNISIYQVFDDFNDLLRQTYSGTSNHASIIDNTIVNVEIFQSTFNNPKASYYVTFDDNFVMSKKFNEAIMGINKRIWFLNTSWEDETALCPPSSTSMLLKLNANGTDYLNNLDSEGVSNFYNELANELSIILPVERSRFSDAGRYQNDPSDFDRLILLQMEVSQPSESTKPCAKDIVRDLDTLIKHKGFTLASLYPITSMLNENYGAIITPGGWTTKMKLSLILVLCAAVLIIILFFVARYRNPKARNVLIFSFALIILDFILDVAFVIYNAQQVSSLFVPSILFVVGPVAYNSILALYIILKEKYTNEAFSDWFMSNTKLVSVFAILSSADIAILNTITSRLGNLSYFCAPISKEAEVKIFWGSFANIFIEDVPQFIIRVIYLQRNSIIYDPIPIFSLISAGVSIIFSLIGRGFDALFYKIPFSERTNAVIYYDEKSTNDNNNNVEVIESMNDNEIIINNIELIKDDDIIDIK